MEELTIRNLYQDEVLDLIRDFPLQPRGRNVIITVNRYEPDGLMILSDNQFSETQYVLAVGSHVLDINPGQKVMLDVEKMLEYYYPDENSHEKLTRVKIKTIPVGDDTFAIIPDSYILINDNRI